MAQPDAGAEGAESEFRVAEGVDGVGGAAGVFDACVHMASKEVLKPVIVCATRSSRCPTRSSRRVPRDAFLALSDADSRARHCEPLSRRVPRDAFLALSDADSRAQRDHKPAETQEEEHPKALLSRRDEAVSAQSQQARLVLRISTQDRNAHGRRGVHSRAHREPLSTLITRVHAASAMSLRSRLCDANMYCVFIQQAHGREVEAQERKESRR